MAETHTTELDSAMAPLSASSPDLEIPDGLEREFPFFMSVGYEKSIHPIRNFRGGTTNSTKSLKFDSHGSYCAGHDECTQLCRVLHLDEWPEVNH
jgi:hypothetical protein